MQSDEAQEQLTLVINIIGTCCGECERLPRHLLLRAHDVHSVEDETYARLDTIKQLLQMISSHPKLARDASAALVDLGDAIREVASEAEIREMIAGTLSKDSNVRNAALQALQVSSILTMRRQRGTLITPRSLSI